MFPGKFLIATQFLCYFNCTGQWRRTKCDCKRDWMWVRSPLEEINYLFKFIFLFLRSGVEAKGGFEFRHSKRNAFRIWRKVKLYTRFPFPIVLCTGYSVKPI